MSSCGCTIVIWTRSQDNSESYLVGSSWLSLMIATMMVAAMVVPAMMARVCEVAVNYDGFWPTMCLMVFVQL